MIKIHGHNRFESEDFPRELRDFAYPAADVDRSKAEIILEVGKESILVNVQQAREIRALIDRALEILG